MYDAVRRGAMSAFSASSLRALLPSIVAITTRQAQRFAAQAGPGAAGERQRGGGGGGGMW